MALASLEEAAKLGFNLVHKGEDFVLFERFVGSASKRISFRSVEAALEGIEDLLRSHPGAGGEDISRSDGIHEVKDALERQAGKPVATETPSGTGADVAGITPDASWGDEKKDKKDERELAPEPVVDPTGTVAETPGEVATGRVDAPTAPEGVSEAPEGTVAS